VNIQKRRVYVPELGKAVLVSVSTKGLKTMRKQGVLKTLKKAGLV
jgi:large subunit ribosomal protein L28